ncbi:MAG: ABC transporter substrate-binding protein [Candidatus Rokuibacteriota bacterium]
MLALIVLLQAFSVAVSGPPTSPEYLPLRVAQAEGYFSREGLSVTLKTTRSEVGAAEALAQGQVDAAATSLEALLRFGPRQPQQRARLVLGLTAAPAVALLVAARLADTVRSVDKLVGLRIGVTAPGAPEQAWLTAVLERGGLKPSEVDIVSLGSRGLASAIARGDVQAGLIHEPLASQLLGEGRAAVLADLRSPDAVRHALGDVTVNAAVFVRTDRRPHDRVLTAFARAMLAAQRRLATAHASTLAERLPGGVVGLPEEFARRLEAARTLYLIDTVVEPEQVSRTIELIRARLPLAAAVRIPKAAELLHTGPLRQAIQSPGK